MITKMAGHTTEKKSIHHNYLLRHPNYESSTEINWHHWEENLVFCMFGRTKHHLPKTGHAGAQNRPGMQQATILRTFFWMRNQFIENQTLILQIAKIIPLNFTLFRNSEGSNNKDKNLNPCTSANMLLNSSIYRISRSCVEKMYIRSTMF